MLDWPQSRLPSLPRSSQPVGNETLASYVGRLARANYLTRDDLIDHLVPDRRRLLDRQWLCARLTQITGVPSATLHHALPELRADRTPLKRTAMLGHLAKAGAPTREACRLCVARRTITEPVYVWVQPERIVCLHHQLWIGPGAETSPDQISIRKAPEIAAAQQKHIRLLARHEPAHVQLAVTEAHGVVWRWHDRHTYQVIHAHRARLLGLNEHNARVYREAVHYPEVIALAGILVSPHWQRLAGAPIRADAHPVHTEIQRRVITEYTPTDDSSDPIVQWMNRMQATQRP